jgi:hypothetical protein
MQKNIDDNARLYNQTGNVKYLTGPRRVQDDGNYVNFTFKKYDNHQDILGYIASPNYMYNKKSPGVCFGFSVI